MRRMSVVSASEGRFPRSLLEFQSRFATESACAQYLLERRWPHGFVCPGCGGGRAWLLQTKAFTYECADCGRQTSVTAGTIMHASKLPLTMWFWAAFLMATHSNGISALQLQNQLDLGSYRTARMLCAKLRRAMVNPAREPLSGVVEADEASSRSAPRTTRWLCRQAAGGPARCWSPARSKSTAASRGAPA